MITMWKAVIEPNSVCQIDLKAKVGAIPRHVNVQDDKICVWFEVDTEKPDGFLVLYSMGTGHGTIPKGARYVGTVLSGMSITRPKHQWV